MNETSGSMKLQKYDPSVARVDMKLEVDIIPVSDVERSKWFYEHLGWRAGSMNQNSRFDPWARKLFFAPAPKIVLQQYRPGAELSDWPNDASLKLLHPHRVW